MYCLKCRRVTYTENMTIATSKNGTVMRRCQCITCWKNKTQFVNKGAAEGSFLNNLMNKLSFAMHLPGHNFTGPGQKSKNTK